MHFHQGTVVEINRLNAHTKSYLIELESPIEFYPGQHTVIRWQQDDSMRLPCTIQDMGRDMSLIQVIIRERLTTCVDDTLFTKIQEGDILELSDGQGVFYADTDTEDVRQWYFMAYDLGIVPIYTMVRWILKSSTRSRIHVHYACPGDVGIWREECSRLQATYPNRVSLTIHPSKDTLWGQISSLAEPTVVLKPKMVLSWLASLADKPDQVKNIFISGYHQIKVEALDALFDNGFDERHLRVQYLQNPFPSKPRTARKNQGLHTECHIKDANLTLRLNETPDLLSQLIQAGVSIPYACRAGCCGTCAIRLIEGQVSVDASYALNADDLRRGWILACQCYPLGSEITIDIS